MQLLNLQCFRALSGPSAPLVAQRLSCQQPCSPLSTNLNHTLLKRLMWSPHSALHSSHWFPGSVRDQILHLREWILACASNKLLVMEKLARRKLHYLGELVPNRHTVSPLEIDRGLHQRLHAGLHQSISHSRSATRSSHLNLASSGFKCHEHGLGVVCVSTLTFSGTVNMSVSRLRPFSIVEWIPSHTPSRCHKSHWTDARNCTMLQTLRRFLHCNRRSPRKESIERDD